MLVYISHNQYQDVLKIYEAYIRIRNVDVKLGYNLFTLLQLINSTPHITNSPIFVI